MPPEMHWLVVLILSGFTCGLGGVVWAFRQAAFVRRIDPASKALTWLTASVAAMLLQVVLSIAAARNLELAQTASVIVLLLNLVIVALGLSTVFSMRASLVRYYNTTEPMGLQLSGLLTFLFSVLYFQYHLMRITHWKKTGRLDS